MATNEKKNSTGGVGKEGGARRLREKGCCTYFLAFFVLLLSVLLSAPRLSSIQPLPSDAFFPLPTLSGKTVVVTGGSSGVGLEAARTLSRSGAQLFVTGRTASRAEKAAKTLATEVVGLELDLSNPESIDAFSESIKERVKKLDVLILNAGMVYGPGFVGPYTVDFAGGRVDAMVASNHLGHFQLLHNLLDLIVASGTRVVIVSSISHYWGTADSVSPSNLVNPTSGVDGSPLPLTPKMFLLYGTTKLLNVLTTAKLTALYSGADGSPSFVTCTPGFAATSIGQTSDRSGNSPLANFPLARSAQQGGDVLVSAATLKDVRAVTGKMLQPYWLWEDADKVLGQGRLLAAFYNFFQEMVQKLSPGPVYAHSVSTAGQNRALQNSAWDWSLSMVGGKSRR